MPSGKGTYGTKVGRPPKKSKKDLPKRGGRASTNKKKRGY